MTWEEFLEWAAYFGLDPWSRQREDLRFEVLRLRLLAALVGGGGQVPEFSWPYVRPIDLVEMRRQIRELDAQLVWDGRRYVFRDSPPGPPPPAALPDHLPLLSP